MCCFYFTHTDCKNVFLKSLLDFQKQSTIHIELCDIFVIPYIVNVQ